jgi:hypothetical protein
VKGPYINAMQPDLPLYAAARLTSGHWLVYAPNADPFLPAVCAVAVLKDDQMINLNKVQPAEREDQSLTRQNTRMRCDACGRFVGMKGSRRLVTPDSDRSSEEYETLCPAHRDQPDVAQSSGDGRV